MEKRLYRFNVEVVEKYTATVWVEGDNLADAKEVLRDNARHRHIGLTELFSPVDQRQDPEVNIDPDHVEFVCDEAWDEEIKVEDDWGTEHTTYPVYKRQNVLCNHCGAIHYTIEKAFCFSCHSHDTTTNFTQEDVERAQGQR